MRQRKLPSLDSLVFFEAAARHKNFSKAALELNVTQAAVSKRIATLESQLGYVLFDRTMRQPALTSEAKTLFESTKAALNFLDDTFSSAGAKIEAPVRIGTNSATQSIFWLQDALKAFAMSETSRGINLLATDDLNEMLAANVDIAIVYGDGKLNNWHSYHLMDEILVPVASPNVADRYQQLVKFGMDRTDLAPPLLDYPRLTPDWVDWDMWFSHVGHEGFSRLKPKMCHSYCSSIGAAKAGKGIALASIPLLNPQLESGSLVRLGDSEYSTGRGYYLCYPSEQVMNENTKCGFDFLQQYLQSPEHKPQKIRLKMGF